MFRLYTYVGPPDIARRAAGTAPGRVIASAEDLNRWLDQAGRRGCRWLVATFVVDSGGRLLLADRHSEHVACASGQPVQAAGEMSFLIDSEGVQIESISNQSTGYCPEPESFPAVVTIRKPIARHWVCTS
jgi:hypothetical protein